MPGSGANAADVTHRLRLRPHDYKRHGTTTLFAALNVLSGEVLASCKPRHRHQEFRAFLREIDKSVQLHDAGAAYPERSPATSTARPGRYRPGVDGPGLRRFLLHETRGDSFTDQSRALASLLFDYELRHYSMVDKEQFLMSPEQLQKLDQGIENRFSQLLRLHTEHSATLGAIYRNYQFVRGQLQQSKSRANGGAEFYVSRAVIDLDDLALAVALSPP